MSRPTVLTLGHMARGGGARRGGKLASYEGRVTRTSIQSTTHSRMARAPGDGAPAKPHLADFVLDLRVNHLAVLVPIESTEQDAKKQKLEGVTFITKAVAVAVALWLSLVRCSLVVVA